MTRTWTTSNTPHYTSLLVGHQLAFVLYNLLPLCMSDQRASRNLHSLPGPSPVLPRGHQGPNAPAAHSPSSEYSGPLPSSSTGGRHPTVSPDTAGWQQRGGRCFHCKPENQDAKWRTHREGGNSTRAAGQLAGGRVGPTLAAPPRLSRITFAFTKDRQLGNSRKRRMSSRFASSAARCRAVRPLLRSLGRQEGEEWKSRCRALDSTPFVRSNVQSNVQDYFRCSLLRRVSPKPQFNGISYSLVFPINFIYLILITFYSCTEQPLKCRDIKCCFRICCIKVHLLCIPEFPDLVATM